MAKILLIVPGSKTFYGEPRYPAAGISMIGAALQKAGHIVRAVDMRFSKATDESLTRLLQEFEPDIAGFTVTNWDFCESLRLAEQVRKIRADIVTIFGGPQPSLCPHETMTSETVDIVVRGEGEVTVVELVEALENRRTLSDVAGILFRNKSGEVIVNEPRSLISDLSTLPRPAYQLFNLSDYAASGDRRLGIFSTRGCPYGCIFCTGRAVMGRKIRCRPPEDVVREMQYWHETAGITHFCFNEDNLLGKQRHGEALLEKLDEAKLPVTYSLEVGVRADALSDEICAKLKKTGCTIVAIGIESVDPEVLKLANKGETIETITHGIRAAKRAGLFVKGYFIVGLPGDSADKVRKAVDYAEREEIDMPRFALAQAFPHTELADWVQRNGKFYYQPYEYVLEHTDEFHGDVHYDFPGFPKEEIWQIYCWAHEQAEAISFKRALIRRFGKKTGNILNLANSRLTRRLVIWLYQHKLVSLPK